MRTIINGKTSIIKLLGKQSVKNGNYRLMKYVLKTACEEGVLLLNVITRKMVLLSQSEAQELDHLYFACEDIKVNLIYDYFLVPDDFNEKDFVLKIRKILNSVSRYTGISRYVILPTTNCNARCFYCYQSNIKHINLSSETTEKLIDYIISHKSEGPLRISWFGGEPLVGMAQIDQICQALKKQNIDYTSSMISNGYLFNDEIVQKAVHLWRLKRIQITLDGTMEIYNKTKAYINNDSNPYQRVLNNIQMLLNKDVYVGIRLNLDSHNQGDLADLIDELKTYFGSYKNFGIYTHVLYENEGFSPLQRDEIITEELYKSQDLLRKKIEEYGLSSKREKIPSLRTHACMADNDNSVCIFPDGRLFKCEHTVDGDEYGHIESGITQTSNIYKFKSTYETEKCCDCPLYPNCILLKECIGTKEFLNDRVCEYNIAEAIRSMKHYLSATS